MSNKIVPPTVGRKAKVAVFAVAFSTSALIAVAFTQVGQAANSPPEGLKLAYSASDMDHALTAFDSFRNTLDSAPRQPRRTGL